MRGMTDSETHKVKDIAERLSKLGSPVLRLQAVLLFSQIVDVLAIGDTSTSRELDLMEQVDQLQNELASYNNDSASSE